MPLPSKPTFVTFDVYGTLIDWETGAYDAFKSEADRDGFTIEREELIPLFYEVQKQIQAGSYELYAEVLRRAAVQTAEEIGWTIEPSRAQFLPDSIGAWPPFREANAAMDRLKERYQIGIVSNVDDKMLGISRRHLRTELDLVVTAQQVRSYKPDPTHLRECARRIGGKKGWVHIAAGYETDIGPAIKLNVPVSQAYTSVTFYTRNSVAYYAINDRAAGRRAIDLDLMTPAQRAQVPEEEDVTAADRLIVESPTMTGLIMIKALAPEVGMLPAARGALANARCQLQPQQ